MDLEKLLRILVEEEGLTEDEAMRIAAARIKAKRESSTIQRRQRGDLLSSVQNDGRGIDYGEETPAEAKARWLEQERNDPNGIYTIGGSTPGGIFGDGAIPMDDFDPGAVNRNLEATSRIQQLHVQQKMLHALHEIVNERRQLQAQPPPRQLDDQRGERRRLGRKKR